MPLRRVLVAIAVWVVIMAISLFCVWLYPQLVHVTTSWYGAYRIVLVVVGLIMAICIGYFAMHWDEF